MTTLEMYIKLAEVCRLELGYDLLEDDDHERGTQAGYSLLDLNKALRELVVIEVAVPTAAHVEVNEKSAAVRARLAS